MIDSRPAVTFQVSQVAPSGERQTAISARTAVESVLGGPVESCSHTRPLLSAGTCHALIAAAQVAFSQHLGLVLTPDVLWITMLQGVARHVQANAEALRSRLVSHDEKARISVRRNDFVKGAFENPWEEVFPAMVEQMQAYLVPGVHQQLSATFSTTGPVEAAVGQVAIMDCLQAYFDYDMGTLCGIPSVTLEGSLDDWRMLLAKAEHLADLWPSWSAPLGPVLEQFVRAAAGHVDTVFWRSMFKIDDDSGGPYFNGWLTCFLPYLKSGRHNLLDWRGAEPGWCEGLTTSQLPSALSEVPFVWDCLGTLYGMRFVGGLVGIEQDPETMAVRPRVGWAVRETTAMQADNESGIRACIEGWIARDEFDVGHVACTMRMPLVQVYRILEEMGYKPSSTDAYGYPDRWTRS